MSNKLFYDKRQVIKEFISVKKILKSYNPTFIYYCNQKISDKKLYVDDIFEKIKIEIENDFVNKTNNPVLNLLDTQNNLLNLDAENIYLFYCCYFFSENYNFFENEENTDYIARLFQILNNNLNKILNRNDVFLILKDEINYTKISYPLDKDNYKKEYFQEENVNHIYKKDIVYFAYDKELKEEDKLYIDLFWVLTKNLYIKYMDYLKKFKQYNNLLLGNNNFEIDIQNYKKGKIVHNNKQNKELINILHLSDCHIYNDDKNYAENFYCELKNKENYYKYNINKDLYKNKKSELIKENFRNSIDLLVITGDVANGGKSSEQILGNYSKAYKEIKKLGELLFGNIWKSRTLVIPGNHDYGMINELKIEIKDRSFDNATKSPVKKEYQRFIFFHFVFEEIYKNNNNLETIETCEYPYILNYNYYKKCKNENQLKKLSFYLFNTSSDANTEISNKVSFEYNEKTKNNNSISIFLMHHTPFNDINYYLDTIKNENLKKYVYGFNKNERKKIISYIIKYNYELLKNGFSKNYPSIDTIKEEIANKNNELNIEIDRLSNKIKNIGNIKYNEIIIQEFYHEQNEIRSIINKNDELLSELQNDSYVENNTLRRNKIFSLFMSSKSDQLNYKSTLNKYRKKIKNKVVILGGHFHTQRFGYSNNCFVNEVGKTIDENNKKNYAILQLNCQNECLSLFEPYIMCIDSKNKNYFLKKVDIEIDKILK